MKVDFEYDEKVYSTNLKLNEQEIKIEITKSKSDIDGYDVCSFIC